MCGEKFATDTYYIPNRGSPPRVRGEVQRQRKKQVKIGITPACAGRSMSAPFARKYRKDHPRVCGEKLILTLILLLWRGSPPRVRGEGLDFRFRPLRRRITPACAGRRHSAAGNPRSTEDHPRVCGEKRTVSGASAVVRGSPPRVRGEGCATRLPCALWRITPACAGRSTLQSYRGRGQRDHPRVCGEKAVRLQDW